MVERVLAAELGGSAELLFEEAGLVFRLTGRTPDPD
jgi:hypothetical protein